MSHSALLSGNMAYLTSWERECIGSYGYSCSKSPKSSCKSVSITSSQVMNTQLFLCFSWHDSPGNAEHHHTDDDHLQRSDDGGDEDIVQFARARDHIEDVVLFDVALGAPEAWVTAEITHTPPEWGERDRERGKIISLHWQINYFLRF